MPQSFTFTLAAWQDLVVPAIVIASVVGSWIHNALKKYSEERKAELGEGQDEFEEMAAHRREQLMQAARQRPEVGTRRGLGSSPDSNLSMADRIARARAQAQQAQQVQRSSRPPGLAQPHPQDPRRQQALAQRQAELRQQQLAAQAQQQAQQQAQLRAQQQTQQRARQQRTQAHARAQAQARQRGTLLHEPVEPTQQPPPKPRRGDLKLTKAKRQPVPELIPEAPVSGSALIGKLSRDDLRKAIVLNEILGKPVALRDGCGG